MALWLKQDDGTLVEVTGGGGGAAQVPGAVICWAGQPGLEPAGWLSCNGAEYLIDDYPALFAVIGTAYGGDGSTLFAVPSLTDRIPRGADQTVGDEGGHAAPQAHDHALDHDHPPSDVVVAGLPGNTSIPMSGTFPELGGTERALSTEAFTGNYVGWLNTPDKMGETNIDNFVGTTGPSGDGDGGNWPPYVTLIYIISTGGTP